MEEEGNDDIGVESGSTEVGGEGFRGLGFKLGSTVEFWSFWLSVSVSGFVEQRLREMALLLLVFELWR